MLINDWAYMVEVTSLLIKARGEHGFSFGVRVWTEMGYGTLNACMY